MRYVVFIMSLWVLAACTSVLSSEYSVKAYNSQGKLLSEQTSISTNQAGLQMARDTLCRTYPQAQIKVFNNITRQEMKAYSPYQCR